MGLGFSLGRVRVIVRLTLTLTLYVEYVKHLEYSLLVFFNCLGLGLTTTLTLNEYSTFSMFSTYFTYEVRFRGLGLILTLYANSTYLTYFTYGVRILVRQG